MTTAIQIPPPWPHQVQALEFIRDRPGAMLAMEMGTGKDLDDRTPIPTPEGWTGMGDLRPGQTVFDEAGNPCTVTAVYPQGERPAYEVKFDDGTVITAGEEHLWVTLTHSHRAKIHECPRRWASNITPITTREITESLRHQRGDIEEPMHSIPLAEPLNLPDRDLPIDPYILGIWLGNGPSAEAAATCHEDEEPHYQEAALAAGEPWSIRNQSGSALTCNTAGSPRPQLVSSLRDMEIHQNQRIPARYLRASAAQRARLLQGLMDTGGYTAPRGGQAEYTTTSEKLAQGVLELVISLGQKATITQGEPALNGRRIPSKWTVIFYPTAQVASLPRKMERMETALAQTGQRYIQDVRPAGTRKTTCITVNSPSGLFLAGREMVPTHNTKVAIDLMDNLQTRRTLILCPVSVADYVWSDQIALHSGRRYKVITLGTKAGTVKKKAETAAREIKLALTHKIPLVIVVNFESAWRDPLGTLLKNFRWDLLIMDESHRLKTPAGKASRFASQMADRSAQRLAMTGTPMPNNPTDLYGQFRAVDRSVFGNTNEAFKEQYVVTEETNVHNNERLRQLTGEFERTIKRPIGYKNMDEFYQKFHSIAFVARAEDVLSLPEATSTTMRVRLSNKAQRVHKELAKEFRSDIEEGKVTNATNALTRLLRLQQVTSGFAMAVNQKTGDEEMVEIDDTKATALEDIFQDLSPSEPIVVFARFIHDLEVIRRVAEKNSRPCWEISGREKQLDEWNRTGGVLVAQIQAGSVGIDMTKARYCIYYSLGYSLGDYLQSCARVHRPGQTRDVHYIHIVAAGTVDETVMDSLRNKEQVIEKILRVRDLTDMDEK